MKRLIALVSALLLAITLIACSNNDNNPPGSGSSPAPATQSESAPNNASSGDSGSNEPSTPSSSSTPTPEATPEPEKVTVDEAVLIDQDGVKITLKSLEFDTRGRADLNMLLENDSSDPITVQIRDVSVNGIMFTSTVFSSGITAGRKINDSISFQSWGFERYGIDTIGTIELSFRIINDNNRDASYNTEIITIQTSVAEQVMQSLPETKQTLFEQDGITISLIDIVKERSSVDVVFFIVNGTEKNITIQARDEAVNGFMISGIMSCNITPGKMAVDTLSFSDRGLGENGINNIEDIKEIEFALRIIDNDDRNGSLNIDVITVTP